MKRRKGYLLLECIISISLILTLVLMLYNLATLSLNIKSTFEDSVELQQQANEVKGHIENIIKNSKGIIGKYPNVSYEDIEEYKEVSSIKCKYKIDPSSNVEDKEIILRKSVDKLFINNLRYNGTSQPGGYEIGGYIDKMYIAISENGKFIKIKLELSKNNQKLESLFSVDIKNLEGEDI